jgi:xylulokinase
MTYLVGTDIGTLGTKTVITDTQGNIQASTYQEYGVINPQQGWAEQWPDIWAEATYATIKEAIKQSKVDPADIAGASISALYGGSGIPLDTSMTPLRPCIIWADRRATRQCQWLRDNVGVDHLYGITGNSAGNYGGIFDIHKRDWSQELMEQLGIPRTLFPERIHSSEEIVGEVTQEGSNLTGLKQGTPICAGGIDAPVSALAGGAIQDGDLASMLGTSMCNGVISHTPRLSPRMINYPYVVNGRHYTYSFTGIATAGYSVRWFRDQLGAQEVAKSQETGVDAYKLLDESAVAIPPGSDGLLFLPHLMIGERAPYWDEHLRGGLLGLGVTHTRAHIFRAVLEGVAYAMRYSLEAAWDAGVTINRATLVDGGARSPLWRQIIADVTGVAMSYIPDAQGAPLGDAILAGLGTGTIKDHTVIDQWIKQKIPIQPNPHNAKKYERMYAIYKKSLEVNAPVFRAMSDP